MTEPKIVTKAQAAELLRGTPRWMVSDIAALATSYMTAMEALRELRDWLDDDQGSPKADAMIQRTDVLLSAYHDTKGELYNPYKHTALCVSGEEKCH
jgi:predicted lipoprotein